MKKNFFKKLAFVLALAMVITSIAPVAGNTAQAATGIAMKNGSTAATVYVTKSYGLKLGTGVKARWTSSDKAVATIGLTSGTLKPVAPGKVTITAKSANTGKSYKKTYTVNLRADSIELGDDVVVGVGESVTVKGTPDPADTTDVIKYLSSDKSIATVGLTGGKVTGVKAGEATITVYSKASNASSKDSSFTKTDSVKVVVGTLMQSIKQISSNKLEIMFSSAVKDLKASDFSIVKDVTNQVMSVKSATVDKADPKKVVVETFVEMKDGKVYNVTHKDTKLQFTATDGVVASLNVTPITVTYGTFTEIKAQTLDAKGVVIGEYAYNSSYPSELEFTMTTNYGYFEGSKLNLRDKGNTASAKVVYHTWKYDDKGNEVGKLEQTFTITAVENAATISNFRYTIGTSAPNWDKLTEEKKSISTSDKNQKVFFFIKDSNDTDITNNYKVESSDDKKLLITEQTIADNKTGVNIWGVSEGTAHIVLKDVNNNVINSLPVTIVGDRKAQRVVIGGSNSQNSILISNGNSAQDSRDVSVKLYDQYQEEVSAKSIILDALTVPSGASKEFVDNECTIDAPNKKITFHGYAGQFVQYPGSYVFRVKATDNSNNSVTGTLTVQVRTPSGSSSYQVVYGGLDSASKVDIKVPDDAAEYLGKTISVQIANMKNGVVDYYLDSANIKVKRADGTLVASSTSASGSAMGVVTYRLSQNNGGRVVKNAEVGNYTVVASYVEGNSKGDLTSSFTIEDTQPKVSFTVKDPKANSVSISDILSNISNIEFYYDGVKFTVLKDDITVDMSEVITTETRAYVKSVTIDVPVNDKIKVATKVTLNQSFEMNGKAVR